MDSQMDHKAAQVNSNFQVDNDENNQRNQKNIKFKIIIKEDLNNNRFPDYDVYQTQFRNLLTKDSGVYQLKLDNREYKFLYVKHQFEIWLQILIVIDGKVIPGANGQINMQLARLLIDLSKDFAITQSFNLKGQVWILREAQIGSHTISIISVEQQLMNLMSGKTPCGQMWQNAKDEGFMQIHGKFQSHGIQKVIRVNLPNGNFKIIRYDDNITLDIGSMDQQKWIVKLQQGKECNSMEQQLTTQFMGDGVDKQISMWLRVF
ncbi:hypothetical protein pb186bvf_014839 [Paramecium bursaria]